MPGVDAHSTLLPDLLSELLTTSQDRQGPDRSKILRMLLQKMPGSSMRYDQKIGLC
jgi:hypothetical protein